MISKTGQDFRRFFLIEFTKELIRNSGGEIFALEERLNREKELKKKILGPPVEIKEKEFRELESLIEHKEEQLGIETPSLRRVALQSTPIDKDPFKVFRISEPKLPPRLQYLRPIPRDVEIDLGKLNPLIKDSLVRVIQCNGNDQNIIVEGRMGRKETGVILSKEEVNKVIKEFSLSAKIPAEEGVVRIFFGRLMLLAIVSEVVSTKFLIRKIDSLSPPSPMMYR